MFTQPRPRQLGFTFLAVLLASCALLFITSLTLAIPARPASTIVINPGDLIQTAIDAANPGDTILINAGRYTESLTLSKAVSLTGVNSATVIIYALPNQRVMTVTGSIIDTSVVISGLTFMGGNAEGGATWESCPVGCGGGVLITETAQPVMQNLIVTRNSASAMGGGLYANGPLTLTGVTFFSNTAQYGGGGAYIQGATSIVNSSFEDNACVGTAWGCFGGGLKAGKAIELRNSTFVSNTVVSGAVSGHGGGVYGDTRASVTNSQFENNRCLNELVSSFCWGGGLFVMETLVSIETNFVNNYAAGSGGGAGSADSVLVRSRFETNSGNFGSGLFTGDVTATDTVFIDNSSSLSGGGIYATDATIRRGLFKNNRSQSGLGGGLRADHAVVTETYFIDNVAGHGGGLAVTSGRVINAVFAGNHDSGHAAAISGGGGPLEIVHTTITSPTLAEGAAISISGSGVFNITNTIITSHAIGIEGLGGIVHEDYNLFYGNTQNLTGTINSGAHDVYGNPNFVDPANNDYHITPPSAAIDAGVDAGIYTDLDDNARPSGSGFDIGAYEVAIATVPITGLVAVNDSPIAIGSATTLTATISTGSNVTYTWNFGDDSPLVAGQVVTHIYPFSTTSHFTATVTAVNSVSVVSATTRVTITDVPLSGLSASNSGPTPIGGTTTLTATISAGSNVTYTWDFGDGSSLAAGQVVTHIYPFSSTARFTATVSAVNSASTQSASTTVVIVPQRVYLPLILR